MKRQIFTMLVAALSLTGTIVACDGSGKMSGNNNVNPAGTCAAGSVYIAAYNGCFSTAQCTAYGPNYGYVPQINQCLPGTAGGVVNPSNPGYTKYWSGSLQILDHGKYREILKDYGLCDFLPFGNWLNFDCNNWDNQASFIFYLSGNGIPSLGQATLVAYSSLGFSPVYLPYKGTVYATNNNTEIELRTTGVGGGYNKIFQAKGTFFVNPVPLTNMGSVQQIRFELFYNGAKVGYSDVLLRW